MLWAALCLEAPRASLPEGAAGAQRHGVACWALQFSPRVALREDAVLLEAGASARLFGGAAALRARVEAGAAALGVVALAWGGSGLGALALARAAAEAGIAIAPGAGGAPQLDALPLQTLSAARAHAETLAQLGCRTLGELRRLPRAGLARRFGAALLEALDAAYGLRPEAHAWFALPETFCATLELQARVDAAPALLFAARRLLLQLGGWLAARQAGVGAFTLCWSFDALRPCAGGGSLQVRSAQPTRDLEHLGRLLGERLARLALGGAVEMLELRADEVRQLAPPSASLLPDPAQQRAALGLALERIAARLGAQQVLRPLLAAERRPEAAQSWQAAELALPRRVPADEGLPQPSFLLLEPLRLELRGERPQYQGELRLLLGPHRIESGWWDRAGAATRHVARDYWVALSPRAGVLWVFCTRPAPRRVCGEAPAWFLHGVFA